MIKIAFVCTGNTCRSAMAECILKKLLKNESLTEVKVTSCGIEVVENEMNPKARIVLKNLGYSPRKFLPKQADFSLLKKQNCIICMTDKQKFALQNFANVWTVDELTGCGQISDPFGKTQEDYDQTAMSLEAACEKIIYLLKEELKK